MDVVNNFLSYFFYFIFRFCEFVWINIVKGGKVFVIDICVFF